MQHLRRFLLSGGKCNESQCFRALWLSFFAIFELLLLEFWVFGHAEKTCNSTFLKVKATDRMSDNCMLHFGWEIHMIVSRGSLFGGYRTMDQDDHLFLISNDGFRQTSSGLISTSFMTSWSLSSSKTFDSIYGVFPWNLSLARLFM